MDKANEFADLMVKSGVKFQDNINWNEKINAIGAPIGRYVTRHWPDNSKCWFAYVYYSDRPKHGYFGKSKKQAMRFAASQNRISFTAFRALPVIDLDLREV